jgi:hypothetical protein
MRAHIILAGTICITLIALLGSMPLAGQQSAPAPGAPSDNQGSPSAVPNPAPAVSPQSPTNAAAPVAPTAPFGEITGIIKSGTTPLPGVTVSAANSLTGKKYLTSTDVDGSYKIQVGSKGRYVVRAELSAFAPVTQEVLITAENRSAKTDLTMLLLSRIQQQEERPPQRAQQLPGPGARAGLQQLSLSGSDTEGALSLNTDANSLANAGLPNAGLAAEGSNESVAVSGNMGRNDMPTFDPGEMQDRIAQMRDQMARGGAGNQIMNFGGGGEGFGGGPMVFMMGGGPGGFGGGGRGMRNFNINKPHGSFFYGFNGSPFDAKPFSLDGGPEEKASYGQSRFGATIGGPLNIPHIYHGGNKTFIFSNYTGTHGNTPYDVFSTVPTQAERSGNFASSSVQLRDPATGLPFANNQLPSINPVAAAILPFIPLPNLPGAANNFHFVSSAPTSSDTVSLRINHNFGADQGILGGIRRIRQQQRQQQQNGGKDQQQKSKWSQSVNGGLSFSRVSNDLLNPFPGLGGQLNTHNYNANAGYTAVKGLFLNSLRFNYNRSNTNTLNHFTGVSNIEGQLGINGISQLPNDFGLPNLTFAPEFSSLQDTAPQFRLTQNFTFADSASLTKGKHGWTWGGDYRHQLIDVNNAPNARGTFVFTGDATGLPLADFLVGFPQQTSVQFGGDNYHFRANAFDIFGQDNWRAFKNFTLNLGLRYEYVSPMTELSGKLVNLDVASGFSAVSPVLPGQVGPITGIQYPNSLINPDRNNFAPRAGIAWRPFNRTVVRTGYSINYNLGQYAYMATQLGFQPPFAFTETNNAAGPTGLTLQNGFPASNTPVTNNYAVDPNYRLAYVQSWNLNIQQEVKGDMVINIGYTGAKGTHLDEVRAPSLDSSNGRLNNAQPFLFESSNGSSILHSGSIRVRKRMRHGIQLGGTYTYSKSIDDASSIGGSAVVVAQNDLDLAAERGLSSFDQRHRFTADYYYQLPFGKEKKWLHGDSWQDKFFGGFAFQGNIALASGFPFSPRIFGSSLDLDRGANGSLRPDIVPGQSIQVSDPSIQEWFNTAAFVAPAKGQFGAAGRNIIEGPGTIDFDMAFSKTIQVKEMQSLEVRIAATNVFNHANFAGIDTTLGSPTFGRVISVASMRKAQLIARYRF